MTLADAPQTSSRDRAKGRGRLDLPPLGFGAAAIGNLYAAVSDAGARETIDAALAAGLAYFDTAPHYGFGLSETRLGEALPASAKVSTKVGRLLRPAPEADPRAERHGFVGAAPFEPVFDYSYDGVMRSFEASLKRLKRDHVDVLLAHDLGAVTHGEDDAARRRQFFDGGYKAMCALRDSGAVGVIGLGVNEWEICDAALDEGDFDVFLLAGRYTLLEQTALDRFLPRCAARDVSIIVGGPFNSGSWSKASSPASLQLRSGLGGDSGPGPQTGGDLPGPRHAPGRGRPAVPAGPSASRQRHPRHVKPGAGPPGPGLGRARHSRRPVGRSSRRGPAASGRADVHGVPMSLILLHPDDNVLVLSAPVRAGQALVIDGQALTANAEVGVGHKLARRALAVGDKVLKYGAPIGSITTPVAAGGHVHLHNMKSDYIASHTRQATGAEGP